MMPLTRRPPASDAVARHSRRPRPRRPARLGASTWLALLCALPLAAAATPRDARERGTAPVAATGAGRRHLHLLRSDPAAGDTVRTSPTAVRLWFSEAPELAITTVRLTSSGGAAVALAPVTRAAGSGAPVEAALERALAAGSYTVFWRTTASDGHPAMGRYQFVVAGAVAPGR